MLIRHYIEALLVDEELADAVWLLWDKRLIADEMAAYFWLRIATVRSRAEQPIWPEA